MERAEIEDLYRRYGPMVLRRARRLLGNEHAAQDAMHEVFIRALGSGSGFRGDASPISWLYRITTNYCLNRIRDNTRHRELREQNAQPATEAAEPQVEHQLAVGQLLALAPEELREVAIYYYIDGLNHAEIAELSQLSRRTIGNRLEAFRELARAALSSAGEATA